MNKNFDNEFQSNNTKSYAEAEEYFNEDTRDFLVNDIPESEPETHIKTIPEKIQVLNEEPAPEIILEPSPPPVPEPELVSEPQLLNLKPSPLLLSLPLSQKKILIAIVVTFFLFLAITLLLQKKSAPLAHEQDQWQLQLARPTFDFSPKYRDWTEVENDYIESTK